MVAAPTNTQPASGPAAKYWMSQVGNGGTEIASGGGFTLYSGDNAGDASDIELGAEEAAAAASSRVFIDYTGKTLEERAELTQPIVDVDTEVLSSVTRLVRGYFHSQDLTLTEIQAKMTLYGDALQAAAAGSVELTLGLMQSLTLPTTSSSGQFTYEPNYTFSSGTTNSASENYYSGDAVYDAYGISKIEFNNSFITIHFKDSASMTAWRSQTQTFEIDCGSGDYTWEKPLQLNDAAMYGSPSYYNYIHYQDSSQLTVAERAEMAAVSTSSAQPFDILINNAGDSVADALGETEVVAKVITDLSLHLAKFPR